MKRSLVQYTVRAVPKRVDDALRLRAKQEGKSLNDILVHSLASAAGVSETPLLNHDLDWLSGTWIPDPALEEALSEQRQIDPDAWR